ncbi:MAG: helix-turn-helix domain-containing protein [Hyphomicrobiaceae bacterium]|nr:helix-turn-helix domain-containing protein [Hyphomicrobiaceae bacterium]
MEAKAESVRKQASDRQGFTAFAVRLKQLRVLRGFRTARSFAQALEIDENRYTRWERGEVEPSVAMLAKMADVLNLPVDILVSGGDVAAALPSSQAVRDSGTRIAASPSRLEPPGMQEDASRFTADRSPEELSQKVLVASRAYLMSLVERRIAGMSQSEIDALIAQMAGSPPDARLFGLEANNIAPD